MGKFDDHEEEIDEIEGEGEADVEEEADAESGFLELLLRESLRGRTVMLATESEAILRRIPRRLYLRDGRIEREEEVIEGE